MKESYLRSVHALLDCSAEEKGRLLFRLDSAVTAYMEDVPEADRTDLAANFGTPEECAARLLDECDPAAILAERQKTGRYRCILIIILVILLIAVLGITAYFWFRYGGFAEIRIGEGMPENPLGQIIYEYID